MKTCKKCGAQSHQCPVCGQYFPVTKKRCETCKFSQPANKGTPLWKIRCKIGNRTVAWFDCCEAWQGKRKAKKKVK